jgi:transposase
MGRRKIEMHEFRNVLIRLRAGDRDREVARLGLMGRVKVAQFRALALSLGWLEPSAPLPDVPTIAQSLTTKPKRSASTVSKAQPWREAVTRWMAAGVEGKAIHAALVREHQFQGSYSSVYRLMQDIAQELPRTDLTVRLSFKPGEAAQVDFGAGPFLRHPDGQMRRTWAFVMTLCHCRHQYLEFVWDQTVATWLGCHRRAFEWFNGVPERVIIDNAKCAIIKACRFDPQVQRSYAECAEGYDFKIDPCPPHDPQKKGIVESGVKYVKGNFLATREFRDLAELNAQAKTWVLQEAGLRTHGTTRQQPLALFALEQPFLKPLPAQVPDLGVWHCVTPHRDCHVKFEHVMYSAPFALVGKALWLRANDGCVALYEGHVLVATHPRGQRKGQRVTTPDHLPPQAQWFFARDRQWLDEQASEVGPHCQQVIDWLLSDKIVERLRAAQGVIGLAKTYGHSRLEAACHRAMAHGSPYYRTVKTILSTNADQLPMPQTSTAAVYTKTRFARDAASLFADPDTRTNSRTHPYHPQQDLLH